MNKATQNSLQSVNLIGYLNDETVKEVVSGIQQATINPEIQKIVLLINSPGGSLYSGFALYDLIKNTTKPIDAVAAGYCASAAVMVLQAAKRRLSFAHTTFMVHPSNLAIEDKKTYREIKSMVNQYEKNHDLFIDLSIGRSGMERAEFEAQFEPRKYLTAKEALKFGEYGLIDEII